MKKVILFFKKFFKEVDDDAELTYEGFIIAVFILITIMGSLFFESKILWIAAVIGFLGLTNYKISKNKNK